MLQTTYELSVIGAGNMGGAVLAGLLGARLFDPASILVCDPSEASRDQCASQGCAVTTSMEDCRDAARILLAIKPQVFSKTGGVLGPLGDDHLVISVMAGLGSSTIRQSLGGGRIVRVMPNTPCQVGKGMSAVAKGEGATGDDVAFVRTMLSPLGSVVDVDEKMIAAVTAVSGSGPAYVFLLAESMVQGARQIGLDPATADALVRQTIIGAAALLEQSGERPMALREAVTSPGGTTAAALEEMFEQELPEAVVEGMMAARNRAVELDLEAS